MKTFEEYLKFIFLEENPQTLDDEMQDKFDGWLIDRNCGDLIDYAEKWGEKIRQAK